MIKKEKETHLVFNPGPPRKKKKISKKRKNPAGSQNPDLVDRLEFLRYKIANTKLSNIDRIRANGYISEMMDIIAVHNL